ncbi:MAG: Holliday junction branch migration protein RuvA [bacterium]|nr:Holliday junction branch migration protein RuvA [bacterium]
MISYLKGNVLVRFRDAVVVNTGGVGYKVFVGEESSLAKGDMGELFCSMRVKENTIELYGFQNPEALELFEMVNTIPGIGPKAALAISSLGSIEDLRKAVREKDEEYFKRVKGVGKKKVQKVILELTGLLEAAFSHGREPEHDRDAAQALMSLGFSRRDALEALENIPNDLSPEEKVKAALKSVRR